MKRIREFLESIAYAGLKPDQKADAKRSRWLGSPGSAMDRLLSGPAPSDPLYLTNRSASQRMKLWVLIGLPCLLLALAIGVALSNILGQQQEPRPAAEPSAKVPARLLPNIGSDLKLDRNHDIEVVEVRVEHTGGSHIIGIVRNTTDHEIANAHLVLDLTDLNGSQVGGVGANIERIPAQRTKTFSVPIVQKTAAFALVREAGAVR
jgi:hypothetical protein